LILLHGMKDHARSWDWTARVLRSDWHVFAFDLRGHGDSAWSPDGAYLGSYHLLDCTTLIDTLGYEQVTLLGHSFGGTVAARYAASFPDRVRKLMLVEGLGPGPKIRDQWLKVGAAQRAREWIAQQRGDGKPPRKLASIDEAVARMAAANPRLSAEQARHLAVHGVHRDGDGYRWKYDPRVGAFVPEEFSSDTPSLWGEITAPILLCSGAKSWTSNPDQDGRSACMQNHRTIVFEEAGHWIHHDRFDEFIRTAKEFL
jgi:pimeloyl-ACP methyl ester carboxylesterase